MIGRQYVAFMCLGLVAVGCGRTQTNPRSSTIVDARALVDAPRVDAKENVDTTTDAGLSYPVVDGGDGITVIDPQYVWSNFYRLLEGTWLIGWYGGQNHFSWIRFPTIDGKLFVQGMQVLSATAVSYNQPYWGCSGAGTWAPTARPATVDLTMPSGCPRDILIFDTFRPVSSPTGAILEATILGCLESSCGGGSYIKLVGLKFPDNYCDAALTRCGKPF